LLSNLIERIHRRKKTQKGMYRQKRWSVNISY